MKDTSKIWIAVAVISILLVVGILIYKKNKKNLEIAAKSVEDIAKKDPSLPRGIRNNNPGNIRMSNNQWKGKIPHHLNTDKAFEQFNTMAEGTRAMTVLIRNWIRKGTANTIEKIVKRYAPPNENNTTRYVDLISDWTGLPKDQVLDVDKETMQKLVLAMARKENGPGHIDQNDFEAAWQIV